MNQNTAEPQSLENQFERCKHHLTKIYETERNIFIQCTQGHKKPNSTTEEHPVFMIRKEAK